MSPSLLLLTALGLCPQAPLPKHPPAALAAMVDLPTAAERKLAAKQLAERADVPLAQWLAAARVMPLRQPAPGSVEKIDARTHRHRTTLPILGSGRSAEIIVRLPADGDRRTGPQPLLFVWHEAGGDAATALATWSALADRAGFVLAAPTETYEYYRRDGWSYHPDGYEGAFLALRFVRRHYDIDEDRIIVAGLRGGGHMAWDVGLRMPEYFAAVVSANGSPRFGNAPRENNLTFVEQAAHLPVLALRWGNVEAMQIANTQRAIDLMRQFGGTRLHSEVVADQAAAFGAASLLPFLQARREVPQRLVRFANMGWWPAVDGWGRTHWLDILRVDYGMPLNWPQKDLPAKWHALDEQARRNYLDSWLRDQTPRLEVTRREPGRFDVVDRKIERFRLLLTEAMAGSTGKVTVTWRGHTLEKAATPSVATFLREFAERFDRTFLPTIVVLLP